MSKVLQNVLDVDPNNPDAVKIALSEFFKNLPSHKEIECGKWLRTLENILNRLPKYCLSHRQNIESYLSHFVNSKNYFDVIEAAKCAHVLQQVRPIQEKTATAKLCWKEHLIATCYAAHKLVEAIFPTTKSMINIDTFPGLKPLFSFTKDSSLYKTLQSTSATNNEFHIESLTIRLRNVMVFIQAALVEVYPEAKPVPPLIIFQVLTRILGLSSKDNDEDVARISKIKIEALKIMDAIILCLQGNLLPYSTLFIKIVVQTIKWSLDVVNEHTKKVRCAAYKSLIRWLLILGPTKLVSSTEDAIVGFLLDELKPHEPVIELTVNAQPGTSKQMSKKAQKKEANLMLAQSSLASHAPGEKNKIPIPEEKNVELVIAALECVEILLSASGIFLKRTTHKAFQELLVRECFNLESHPTETAIYWVRALDAARRGALPVLPAPTQYCLRLYGALLARGPPQVTKFCSEALLNINLHLHRSPPSISFDLEAVGREKLSEKRTISERNRAALVSLLGEDKVPDDSENVVIDLSDEPTRKRRRQSLHVDSISLSSQSNDAVIIDDVDEEMPKSNDSKRDTEQRTGDQESVNLIAEGLNINPVSFEGVLSIESLTLADLKLLAESEIVKECAGALEESNDGPPGPGAGRESDENSQIEDTTDAPNAIENIHEAITQMPAMNISNDTTEGDRSPLSMEVTYDFPNTGKDRVRVMEKAEENNLPSTNDTDDVHITCGQKVQSSQDDIDNNKENELKTNGQLQVNGNNATGGEIKTKDNPLVEKVKQTVTTEVTVEDMLADFVDEIADDNEVNT